MNTEISVFKESMRQMMLSNFKIFGFLTPITFFLYKGKPIIEMIPEQMLATPKGKEALAQGIQQFCTQKDVSGAGIIMEAWGAELDGADQSKPYKPASQLPQRKDIIIMIFSTPYSEELFAYVVDPKNKAIVSEFGQHEKAQMSGTFSQFFKWNRN
jgi:hypothetical protein